MSSDAGTYKVRVTATDKGIGNDDATEKSARDDFVVEVVCGERRSEKTCSWSARPG